MRKKDHCAVFGCNNDRLFPEKYALKFSFCPKSPRRYIVSECPTGHPIILLKSNKLNNYGCRIGKKVYNCSCGAAEPRGEWVQVNCKIRAWRRKKVTPARTYRQLRRLSKKNLGPEPVIKIMKCGRSGRLIPYFLII